MDFYVDAFYELSTERREAGLQIPWSAIDRYGERHGMEGEFLGAFTHVIREMDRQCLRRAKSEGETGGKSKGIRPSAQ